MVDISLFGNFHRNWMINLWILKYPIFRQTHMEMRQYVLEMGMDRDAQVLMDINGNPYINHWSFLFIVILKHH